MFARTRALLAGAAALAITGSAVQDAAAQIVPETSAHTSAANSPAAAVQTGFRRRLDCAGCDALFSGRGEARVPSLRDAASKERATQIR